MNTIYVYCKKTRKLLARARHKQVECCVEKVVEYQHKKDYGFFFDAKEFFEKQIKINEEEVIEL